MKIKTILKRILIIIGAIVAFLVICYFLIMYAWIGPDVKEQIAIAKAQYPGTAEDALIACLSDTTHSPHERGMAVWTLGQIKSKKSLPVLKKFYKNDPKGKTCHHRHNSILCQREIYDALYAIEKSWLPLRRDLNK